MRHELQGFMAPYGSVSTNKSKKGPLAKPTKQVVFFSFAGEGNKELAPSILALSEVSKIWDLYS